MKTKYLLAMSGNLLHVLRKYNEQGILPPYYVNIGKKHDIRFYKKGVNSYFHHGDLLFSAFHFRTHVKKGKTLASVMGLDNDPNNMIFIDSGGYSIATGTTTLDKWGNKDAFDISIQNGNIFPILDIPPVAGTDFDECLKLSYESAKYYKAHKPGNGEIILNVAHGRNLVETKKWTDKISKVELDGWAVGSSHEGNPKQIIKGLFFMLTSGYLEKAKAFHIFGVSSASMCIYFAAIKHAIRKNPKLKYDFNLTFDSSYPVRTAAFGRYFMFPKFDGFTDIVFSNKCDWSKLSSDDFEDGFICDCPVCQDITDFHGMMNNPEGNVAEAFAWSSLHNIYQMKKYIRQVSTLVEMTCDMPELGEHILPSKVNKNIQVIMEAFDNIPKGEEIIERKFEAVEVSSGASLDGFFN